MVGVTILATKVVTMTNPVMNAILITLGIIAGLGFLFISLGIIMDCLGIGVTGIISLIAAFILFIICIPIDAATQVPDYNRLEEDKLMRLFKEKPLNKNYKIEGKGFYFLNYLFNKHFLNKDDYIEEYENIITGQLINKGIDPKNKKARIEQELLCVLALLKILPEEEQKNWLFKIDCDEDRELIKKGITELNI